MKKILVADDEEYIRELVCTTIGLGSYEIFKATNGEEALEMAKKVKPDLMLLDVRMPKMTGFEVCKAIKDDPETRGIYVIILSAFDLDEDKRQGTDAGANDYFVKPFSPIALLDKVSDILDNKN